MNALQKALNEYAAIRWGILFLVGFVLSVNYYFYDALSPLKSILESEFGFSSTDFGLFVAFYSIPNTFFLMAVLGGIILDKIGIRRTGFLFIVMMAIGAFLTAYGTCDYYRNGGFGYSFFTSFLTGYSPELKMMLLGRFFFGLGAETSIVVVSKIIVKWFKGKDLALAFGVKIGFGRLGTAVALNLSPALAHGNDISVAVWLAAVLVATGLMAFVVYIMFDIRLNKQITQERLLRKNEEFRVRDIVALLKNKSFIYVALLCVTFYSAVFPFQSFAPDFFLNKFGVTLEISGSIASMLSLGTLIFTPLFGLFIDKRGKSASLMFLGSFILVIVHLTFAFTMISPYIPMIFLGMAFSLVPAAMWPTVVKLVKESRIGTAYGLMYSIQNLGLWGIPILAGMVLDASNPPGTKTLDYTNTILIFAGLGLLGLLFSYLLKRADKKDGYGLELPSNKRGFAGKNEE